jgi:chromate transporter
MRGAAVLRSVREIFWAFFKLGWLAFGGPVGQIGLMHLQVVERQKWLSEEEFVRTLSFCHILPGPEALQLAIFLGHKRGGYLGGALAGALFILPGFVSLTALAWVYVHYGQSPQLLGVLWGFRPVGFALVLAALLRISKASLKGVFPVLLAVAAFAAFTFAHVPFVAVLFGCGLVFIGWRKPLAALLLFMPARAEAGQVSQRLAEISSFFLRVGLFSFGGAYAVLPYIRAGAVSGYGWITDREMIDALALGETTPGPLISIGIFVGYLAGQRVDAPWSGALAATFWLFLPSFVFVLGAARHIDWVTSLPSVKEFLKGVTSGVVGLMASIAIPLAKVSFMPGGAVDWLTVALALAAFAALTFWKWRLNVVAVVLAGGLLGLLRAFTA